MATRASFLNIPFGGYLHRDIPSEEEELAQVGPDTPCGEYMRRFWQPIIVSEELKDLPVSLRILGEDLVAFRDKTGHVGLLELHCSHRGTSLEFGQIAEKGIRCCYHGWLFDVDGRILETPGEPADSTLKDRLCHGAYPVEEYAGLVFAYMGPLDQKPQFPLFDTFQLPGYELVARPPLIWPCNWLQVKENCMDPAHLAFLHTLPGSEDFTMDLAELGQWDWMETPAGTVYIDTRREGDKVWVRVADFIPPNIHQFPPNQDKISQRTTANRPQATTWAVPLDDTHTMQIGFYRAKEGQPVRQGGGFGQDDSRPYEERQRTAGDYDAQVSQRDIAVHGLEHLASTDRGVTMLRNTVRRGIRSVLEGQDPLGVVRKEGQVTSTYSHDRVLTGIPPAPTPEEDIQLLRDTGRKVVEDCINGVMEI